MEAGPGGGGTSWWACEALGLVLTTTGFLRCCGVGWAPVLQMCSSQADRRPGHADQGAMA